MMNKGVNFLFELVMHAPLHPSAANWNCSPGSFFHIALLGTAVYHSLSGPPNPAGNRQPNVETLNPGLEMLPQIFQLSPPKSARNRSQLRNWGVEELCRPWHREWAHLRPSHEAIPLLLTSPRGQSTDGSMLPHITWICYDMLYVSMWYLSI